VRVAGVALGGIDTQYARGDFYPGVAQFALELAAAGHDRARSRAGAFLPKVLVRRAQGAPREAPPKIAVLTARAIELKWALQLKDTDPVCMAFQEAGRRAGYGDDWGIGTVLCVLLPRSRCCCCCCW